MENKNLLSYFSNQVNLYLDNRLNPDGQETLMNAVDQDQQCGKVFRTEKNFRDFVKNNVKRPCASNDLIKSIKDKCC